MFPFDSQENIESTQLQYGLVDRAKALGWPDHQIVVIDDDLGISAQSMEGRAGFQRLLVEIGLGHVGLVLGIEMSRLARSCRDWHHLLELCAVFGSLLGDADGVYEPRDHNDRLLLGLKGTMSEAELHVLRGRLDAGKRNKARRGEYYVQVPIGYLRIDNGVVLEPDEQARGVVRLVFDMFEEVRSVNAVLRHFRRKGFISASALPKAPTAANLLGGLRIALRCWACYTIPFTQARMSTGVGSQIQVVAFQANLAPAAGGRLKTNGKF